VNPPSIAILGIVSLAFALTGCSSGGPPVDDDDASPAVDDDDTEPSGTFIRVLDVPFLGGDFYVEGAIWADVSEDIDEYPGGIGWQVIAAEGLTCERYVQQVEALRTATAQWQEDDDLEAFQEARRVAFTAMVDPGWHATFGALRPAAAPPEGEINPIGPTKFASLTEYLVLDQAGHSLGGEVIGIQFEEGRFDSLDNAPVVGSAQFRGVWSDGEGGSGDLVVEVDWEADICPIPPPD